MSNAAVSAQKLKMVACGACQAKVFVPGSLPPFGTTPCNKCGHPVMAPVRLRQFELRAVIASGGMGVVYRARDLMLERDVAVKLMKPELTHDEAAVQAFYREARACAALNHTHIVHIYTFDTWEDRLYMAMELADRGSVDQRIEQEGHLPELDVLDIGIKIASALDTAHKHGLLHRDLKPGNILYNADREPKLVDFGLSGHASPGHAADETYGTPYYVAPEKIKREAETFLSDLYSLAATLYHAITGHVPFEAPTVEEIIMAHVHTPPTPPNEVVRNITQPTSDALLIALQKEPAHRHPTYDEFIMALTAARSQLLVMRYNQPHHE
jgi:serine/threonine protein kinase